MAVFIDKFCRYCGSAKLSALIAINTAVFILVWLVVVIGDRSGLQGNFTLDWLCVASSPEIFARRPWTCLTYMVTQYDFFHLLFNMLWLLWFGKVFLVTLTGRHLLFTYIAGGIIGAAFYIAWQSIGMIDNKDGYLCGASASVLAIMTAAALRTPNLRLNMLLFGEVKLKWVAIVCGLLTFIGVGGGNAGGQAAHLGGVVLGALFILSMKQGYDLTKIWKRRKGARQSSKPETIRPTRVRNTRRDGEAVAKAMAQRLSDTGRLDELLDKIRISGYSSLTYTERHELNALSKRLENQK